VFWVSLGMYGQMAATILSHGIFLVTLPLVTISLGLQGIDPALLEAARTMGATRGQVLRTVVMPLVLPYLVSGYAFAFVLSLNEYIIAYMVAGFTVETLPIKIFNSLRYGYTPIMGVVSVLFVGLAIVVYGAIGIFGNLPRLLGAERAAKSPAAAAYARNDFRPVANVLEQFEPVAELNLDHPYFQRTTPRTMLIDEVEAIWAPIAEHDDWSAFENALGEIRLMAEAYGKG